MEQYSHKGLDISLSFPSPWRIRHWGNMSEKQRNNSPINYQTCENQLPNTELKQICLFIAFARFENSSTIISADFAMSLIHKNTNELEKKSYLERIGNLNMAISSLKIKEKNAESIRVEGIGLGIVNNIVWDYNEDIVVAAKISGNKDHYIEAEDIFMQLLALKNI